MGKQVYQSSMKTAFNLSSVFTLGTDKVKNKDRKYGFDGLQVVKDNLQTAINQEKSRKLCKVKLSGLLLWLI